MKRLVVFLMIAGLTTMCAFGQKKETREVSGFTGIEASDVFEITVTKGSSESLVIEADEEVIQYVSSEVKNSVLYLSVNRKKAKVKHTKTLKAYIVMRDLDMVSLKNACKLTTADLFTPNSFSGDCSGACNMTININTGKLSLKVGGSSNVRVKANVTGDTDINVGGAINLQGELNGNNVKFDVRGSCFIDKFSGSATNMEMILSGAANFKAEDFKVKTAVIKSSGSSIITVNATDVLKLNFSGASSVNYKGAPDIEINGSGSSKNEFFTLKKI